MYYLAQTIARYEIERASAMLELFQSTTRKLLILSTVFWLCGTLLVSGKWGGDKIPLLLCTLLVTGIVFWFSASLLGTRDLPALIGWMIGSVIAILAGSWLMEMPSLILLGSFLPLVAVILIDFWGGTITLAGLCGLVWLLGQPFSLISIQLDLSYLIIISGCFSLMIGWAVSNDLISVSAWSMASFKKARQDLSEVRERQIELFQAQEDLQLANTELGRLSQRLKVLEHIAEEARQAKTEFVANVSHELRTPLNMIIGYADLISRSPQVYGGRLPASLLTDIMAILRNAQHLSTLVNDVLDLSQVESGRMAISRSWVSIDAIIAQAMSVVAGLFQSRGLYLKSEIEPDLPTVYCDETRIRQVIINLLSNAGRFTEHGGVTIHVMTVIPEVIIRVSDTGTGIELKDQERIFEPFQQADASIRRRFGGSGLGLTISKQFVEMHGGKMWLESQPGKGTSFSLSLPLSNPHSTLKEQARQTSSHTLLRALVPDDEIGYRLRKRRSQAPAVQTTERFVVIDSENYLQRLLSRYLPESEIESALNLNAAVESLSQSPAQALVVNTSHFEDMPQLGRLPFGTPAITCFLPGGQDAARHLGVFEYLIKPLAREKLLAAVESLDRPVKTILIVNDQEDELNLFARHLKTEERGYSILQVTSGQRALGMLRSRKPDVMLLDLMMPGMDGFQVLEEKQRDASICDIPVIIISSRDPAGDPIVSNTFTVTHSGGLSQRNLAKCIHSLGEILAPSVDH
jgi:signal transduction histidine kinase/CheY-like chemotaxis protein